MISTQKHTLTMVLTDEDRQLAKATREFKQRWREGDTDTTPPAPISTPTITPVNQVAPLDKLERLLEQQVRIKSMSKFMRDMDAPTTTPQEKKSDLEMFEQFTKIQTSLTSAAAKQEETLRQRIMDSIAEGDMEPETGEDAILKMLSSKLMDGSIPLMKNNPQEAPMPSPTNIQQTSGVLGSSGSVTKPTMDKQTIKDKTDAQIIKEIPQYVKDAIKSGGLTMETVITGLKSQGQEITAEEQQRLEKIYNKIKKQK